jgi:hypothetical protein
MVLGERRTLPLPANAPGLGYWNPALTWWQPTADVAAKFGGRSPGVGEVFWFPLPNGAALPTRVAAVGPAYVELDANEGLLSAPLLLEVHLVALHKAADAAPTADDI